MNRPVRATGSRRSTPPRQGNGSGGPSAPAVVPGPAGRCRRSGCHAAARKEGDPWGVVVDDEDGASGRWLWPGRRGGGGVAVAAGGGGARRAAAAAGTPVVAARASAGQTAGAPAGAG